jgi:hypothetical protein
MNQSNLLRKVVLGEQHSRTGLTRHTRNGKAIPPPTELRIVQYSGDTGYYLLYCDESGEELTDTYHITLAAAFEQARAEFGVEPSEWQ